MAELQLSLSQEENQFLTTLLLNLLRDKRVEEHRTRTPSYRGEVIREEELIANVLRKLGNPVA